MTTHKIQAVAKAFVPMQYATTSDGIRIAFISVGDGSPIVFASNIFGDATRYAGGFPHMRDFTDRLAGLGWRVIRYDHRGMGASDRDVDDLSLDARVRDMEAVVGALGIQRFALAGIDIAAATAVAYAVKHKDQVSHLALLSPWASGARYLKIPALRAAYAAEATNDRELFAKILASVVTGFKDPELVQQVNTAFLQPSSASGLSAFNAATARIDLTPLLPQVTVPTVVTHEPAFSFGSFELCQEVAAGIRGAEFVIVADNSIAGRVHDENLALIDRFLRAGTALGGTAHGSSEAIRTSPTATNGLTPREAQVLRQVADGSTNKEIADELGVAVSTVERHLVNLYAKIGARGRADAVAFAVRHGVGRPS